MAEDASVAAVRESAFEAMKRLRDSVASGAGPSIDTVTVTRKSLLGMLDACIQLQPLLDAANELKVSRDEALDRIDVLNTRHEEDEAYRQRAIEAMGEVHEERHGILRAFCNLVAYLDGDGGHAQQGESWPTTHERASQKLATLVQESARSAVTALRFEEALARSRCGCTSLDCTKHGACVPEDAEWSRAAGDRWNARSEAEKQATWKERSR